MLLLYLLMSPNARNEVKLLWFIKRSQIHYSLILLFLPFIFLVFIFFLFLTYVVVCMIKHIKCKRRPENIPFPSQTMRHAIKSYKLREMNVAQPNPNQSTLRTTMPYFCILDLNPSTMSCLTCPKEKISPLVKAKLVFILSPLMRELNEMNWWMIQLSKIWIGDVAFK